MPQRSAHKALETAKQFVVRSPVAMALVGLDGAVIAVSPALPAWTLQLGVTGDYIGETMATAWPEAGARFGEVMEQLREGTPVVQIDQSLELPGGRKMHSRSMVSYWRDDDGQPAAVLCVLQDISAEIEARKALARSAAQLRAVVENIPAQISVMELESGRLTLMNSRMRDGLATYSGAAEGAIRDEVLTEAQKAALELQVLQAEAAGGVAQREITLEHGVAAGSTFRVRYTLYKDDEERRHLLCTAEDITQLRRSAEALKQAAAEAEAANRAKSEFLANMSHEIRTPLNGVMGVAGALARTELAPAQREMVSLVETSARTLETLLSDILDLARIEAGKMELRPEPFDLAASVNACAALFDAAAQAKGLDLEVFIGPEALGAYVGDAARIRQILSNLLGNAVKFTQAGHVRLTVRARREELSSRLVFEVRDSGIGFDADTKARLFSRFEQADGSISRRFGGSGLGLSICRSLAEAMGGRVEGDATPGEGAVFTLTLELPRCEGALDLWCEDEPLQDEAADPLAGMRVLLAEDHPTNRRVVELILGAAGVDLTCVENGVEAVDAFRRNLFDLILMDMQMPLMDGLTAIEEIRRLEAASGAAPTPIHVLTANAMPEHVSASHAAGADGHLSKPILADALLARLAEVRGQAPPVGPVRQVWKVSTA